jgi:hypothetical protein
MKLKELAEEIGQSVPFVMALQKKFDLPQAKEYPVGYAALLRKLLFLSLCCVPQKEISSLLARERKLLELLKVDSLTGSPTWFEDLCVDRFDPKRLLLSGYDLGHVLNPSAIQTGLDFAEREKELFGKHEMGDNVLRALQLCVEAQEAVLERLRLELPGITGALKWARRVCA